MGEGPLALDLLLAISPSSGPKQKSCSVQDLPHTYKSEIIVFFYSGVTYFSRSSTVVVFPISSRSGFGDLVVMLSLKFLYFHRRNKSVCRPLLVENILFRQLDVKNIVVVLTRGLLYIHQGVSDPPEQTQV